MEELPESLDETYERILREIRKSNQGHAHRLLQCLVAAVRPLRVEELAEVVAVDFNVEGIPKLNPIWRWEDQEEAVMSACSSLVIVVKDVDSRIVQFSHFSVKEYLTSDRLAESSRDISRYYIPLESAHTILAQACLGVLLRLDDRIDRNTINYFPLAEYAADHWVEHAQFGDVASYIKAGIESLFDVNKPHFATWLWIYNSDYRSSPEKPEVVPLYYAAQFGLRNLTEHLLAERPGDVHAKGGYELTPLHAAARYGYADILSLLLEHFPDLDFQGKLDQTPLHRASRGGHIEAGQCLLDRGAGVNAQDVEGWTPLHVAAMDGHVEFAQMLLERGAEINIPDKAGNTPLHAASIYGHPEFVRLLLKHSADLNARNDLGRSPSDRASSIGQREIVQLLSEYSSNSVEE
jgi:Ankyrin repeats (3 copies)/Ankyrin repeats (many copies)